jgi:Na+-transporting methylmalonyl-CoA/oxaloacetate decarboxylase gamma subunit
MDPAKAFRLTLWSDPGNWFSAFPMALMMLVLILLFLVQSIHVIQETTATATSPPSKPPTTAPMIVPLELDFPEGAAFGEAATAPHAGTVQFIKGLLKALSEVQWCSLAEIGGHRSIEIVVVQVQLGQIREGTPKKAWNLPNQMIIL